MDKNMSEMTDDQKQTYYVTKIARLSSEAYKYAVGFFLGMGVCLCDLVYGDKSVWHLGPEMMKNLVLISTYCGAAYINNRAQEKTAYNELAKLNETKVKKR